MRLSAAILVMALMSLTPAQAVEKTAPVYELEATGTIEIGPDGEVFEYQLDKGQPEAIENALGRSIQQWHFEPILVDGNPVIAKTRMRMAIEALPTPGKDYQLRIGGVWFGEPDSSPHRMAPPPYPRGAAKAGVGAKTVLVLQLNSQGTVEQAHAEQVSLSRVTHPSGKAERWRDAFAKACIAAAKKWQFDISETLDGDPIGTSVRVPVEFFLADTASANPRVNAWRSYIPGPRVPAPWIAETSVAAQDMDELKDGDVRSLASNFKLKGEVVGKLL